MISQTAEYALRAVVFLAERRNEPHTIRQIAQATLVPEGYLAKVMLELGRHGLVRSQRGIKGGTSLAIPALELTVYTIVQAVDPIHRITQCPLNNPNHATELCALHHRLDEAAALIENCFRNTTIADLARQDIFAAAGG